LLKNLPLEIIRELPVFCSKCPDFGKKMKLNCGSWLRGVNRLSGSNEIHGCTFPSKTKYWLTNMIDSISFSKLERIRATDEREPFEQDLDCPGIPREKGELRLGDFATS